MKKITDAQLIDALAAGLSRVQIAKRYGMTAPSIYGRCQKMGLKVVNYWATPAGYAERAARSKKLFNRDPERTTARLVAARAAAGYKKRPLESITRFLAAREKSAFAFLKKQQMPHSVALGSIGRSDLIPIWEASPRGRAEIKKAAARAAAKLT